MSRHHPRGLRRNGFTLVEALIVLGVLAILLAIGIPNLNRYIQSSRFQQGVKVFEEALITARDTATRTSSPVRFEVNGANLSWADSTTGTLLDTKALPFGIAVGGGNRQFVISGRGMPQVQERFELANENFDSTVYLLPTGAVLR